MTTSTLPFTQKSNYSTKHYMKDYSNYLICKFSKHARRVTVAEAKAVRLRVKNLRRKKNGLPPKATYAEI